MSSAGVMVSMTPTSHRNLVHEAPEAEQVIKDQIDHGRLLSEGDSQ
jgi:hypothetical protein